MILFVPLKFFFVRHVGLALPLIALQYHDVRIDMEFRNRNECINLSGLNAKCTPVMSLSSLLVNYIYLDTEERKKFAQASHEYLIEQLQYTGEENINASSNSIKINFTHPVKELVWVIQPTNFVQKDFSQSRAGRQYFNFTDSWDYTSFSGTPEPASGPGLVGGKGSQNLFYGLPSVKVNGELNTNNNWTNSLVSGNVNVSK